METKKYDFGTLKIADHFIIGEMNENTDIQLNTVSRIIEIANNTFHGEKWGYISNRVHSYSLNPLVHEQAPKFEKNMVAFAVVINSEAGQMNAELEKFISNEQYLFESFYDLEEAINWIKQILSEQLP